MPDNYFFHTMYEESKTWFFWNALELHQTILYDILDGATIDTTWTTEEKQKILIDYYSDKIMAIHKNG